MAPNDLKTIRALSQYRPFEGGGASVREAHADLTLAALAEAGGACGDMEALRENIHTLFQIDLSELSLGSAVSDLIEEGRLVKNAHGYTFTEAEAARLEAVAAESQAIANAALAEWRQELVETWTLTSDELEHLTGQLGLFLKAVMRRHGAEASLLLYPESERSQRLYASIEAEGFNYLPDTEIPEIRDYALSSFIKDPTEAQRAYLAQNLNAAYFLTILSIDPEGARLISEIVKGQRVYLDTNFLYRLLGVQGPRFIKPAEAILLDHSKCRIPGRDHALDA